MRASLNQELWSLVQYGGDRLKTHVVIHGRAMDSSESFQQDEVEVRKVATKLVHEGKLKETGKKNNQRQGHLQPDNEQNDDE